MNEGQAIAHTCLSFFASDAEVQLLHVRETDSLFLNPQDGVTARAHFVAGLYCLLVIYKNNFWDAFDLPEDSAMGELADALHAACILRPASVWEPSQLATHPAWAEVRSLAAQVLSEAGLSIEDPLGNVDLGLAVGELGWRPPVDI